MKRSALFLDRDGTINVEKNYVYRIEDFEFREGIFELVKGYSDRGYLIFVVTNQSGLARGYYTLDDFLTLTGWMVKQFSERGISIAKVYYCPHHPGITGQCQCRKPAPGMILEAITEFDVDAASSVLIGDMETDLEAGRRAGIGRNYKINEKGRLYLKDDIIHKG